jgi:hypothetical protein
MSGAGAHYSVLVLVNEVGWVHLSSESAHRGCALRFWDCSVQACFGFAPLCIEG